VEDPNSKNIYVLKTSKRGRGVFARRKINRGELIERSPVIVIPGRQWSRMDETILSNYVFDWGEKEEHAAVALGYISIYNHSYTPNAELTECLDEDVIEVSALRDINADEEIFVNYNGAPDDRDKLWFEVIETAHSNRRKS
jgi:SET domain-containing protein